MNPPPIPQVTLDQYERQYRGLVILEPGAMPMNRTAKVDVARLQQLARDEAGKLRERGRWDG
jgi:hypothetical protein